ncbi:MAG: hypothetical protein KAI72_02700 [Candidatus Pacebacteria bacterium]|nr:hypothetical protein [Candidatus Paceibacterota bacterium]
MNILIIVSLLTVLVGGTVNLLSIEEDLCRGRSCLAGIQANLKTVQVQGELFYDSNGYRYSATNLTSPFSGKCPEFGDGDTMFAKDRTIANAIETVKKMGSENVNCYMPADAQSWAIDVRFKNDYYDSWCADSMGNAGKTTINPITGLCSK